VWGWATWARAWARYDKSRERYRTPSARAAIAERALDPVHGAFLAWLLDTDLEALADAWDHQWMLARYATGGLSVVPARNLCALPASVPFEVGAIVMDAVATPFHALVDVAKVQPGEAVAVVGAGGLGLHAVQIAKLMGAYPVIAVDVRAAQRDRAAAHGADVVVDPGREAVAEAVLSATGGAGAAVAAEFVGHAETIGYAVESLAVGGRAVICGLGAEPITAQAPIVFVRRELQILGSYGFTISTLRRVLALVDAGLLDLGASITHRFPLAEADRALQTLHEKLDDPQRVVVIP